jgi:hypothetical protein
MSILVIAEHDNVALKAATSKHRYRRVPTRQ